MARHNIRNFIALAGFSASATYAAPPSTPFTPTTDTGRNTAIGTGTLSSLGTPNLGVNPWIAAANTAAGVNSLNANTSGSSNSAVGADSLNLNTTGDNNTAIGQAALLSNTSGNNNSAVGNAALDSNVSGNNNNAMGNAALFSNTTGSNNTAVGYLALFGNTVGPYGTALGYEALYKSQSGLANIGVGPFAGQNIVQGQLNIDVGSWGSVDESNTIRIGIPQYHLHTYIAGIATTQLTGAQVVVSSSGQLGVLASSEIYKADIASLGSATDKLASLRPVSFHLKLEPNGVIQYGLIAEEVDKVYPELVIRDADGKIQGVRYDELAPMLLNEVQRQQVTMLSLTERNDSQAAKIASLEQRLEKVNALEQQLKAALDQMRQKDQIVAQR